MGLFEHNYEADVLRAIGHARLHISAGKGLESIIFELERAEIGVVSEALTEPLARMQVGWATDQVLQETIEAAQHKAFAHMLIALLSEGEAALRRLDEISDEIQLERRLSITAYGDRIASLLNIVTILFLGTFIPIFIKVFELIPDNAILPQIKLPYGFYAGYFVVLAVILTVLLLGLRSSE